MEGESKLIIYGIQLLENHHKAQTSPSSSFLPSSSKPFESSLLLLSVITPSSFNSCSMVKDWSNDSMEPSKSPLRRLEFVRLSKRWTSETDDSTDAKAVITIMGKAERNKTEYRTN